MTEGALSPISFAPVRYTWYSVSSFKPSTEQDVFVRSGTFVKSPPSSAFSR